MLECSPGYHIQSGECEPCPGQEVAFVILYKHLLNNVYVVGVIVLYVLA
jgi:hypothetical protein